MGHSSWQPGPAVEHSLLRASRTRVPAPLACPIRSLRAERSDRPKRVDERRTPANSELVDVSSFHALRPRPRVRYLHHPVARPRRTAPVARAQLSEQFGFDLVTFQDHPYQPAFLDTWTLMTWVAAQTERIRIAAERAQRAAAAGRPYSPAPPRASTCSRAGASSSPSAPAASGTRSRRWAAAASRRARPSTRSSEAIDVIRGIWDVERPQRAARRRRLLPASTAPSAARRPRTTSRSGSAPSSRGCCASSAARATAGCRRSPTCKPGDLARGNATIDEAAIGAGRDPREIRRLLNIGGRFTPSNGGFLTGPSAQWVDELLPYVLDDGVGTFILASDDPGTMQRFAEEVAPALREAVDAERGVARHRCRDRRPRAQHHGAREAPRAASTTTPCPRRSRRSAIEPGDVEATPACAPPTCAAASPGLVLRPCDSTAEVVEAVAFARAHPAMPLGVRSGGHGISGRSTNDGGIVIDLSAHERDRGDRMPRAGACASSPAPAGWMSPPRSASTAGR